MHDSTAIATVEQADTTDILEAPVLYALDKNEWRDCDTILRSVLATRTEDERDNTWVDRAAVEVPLRYMAGIGWVEVRRDLYRLTTKGALQINQAPMTPDEQSRLETCEATILGGLQSFVDVGTALAEIQDARLYRATHGTFKAYLHDRWGFGPSYASRLIGAAETVKVLPKGNSLPTAETQVRPLLQFAPEDRAEVWATVEKQLYGDVPTASKVEKIIRSEIHSGDAKPFKKRRTELRKAKRERREQRGKKATHLQIHNLDDAEVAEPMVANQNDLIVEDDADESVGSTVRDWLIPYAAVLGDEDLRTLLTVARETLDRIEAERFGGTGG